MNGVMKIYTRKLEQQYRHNLCTHNFGILTRDKMSIETNRS